MDGNDNEFIKENSEEPYEVNGQDVSAEAGTVTAPEEAPEAELPSQEPAPAADEQPEAEQPVAQEQPAPSYTGYSQPGTANPAPGNSGYYPGQNQNYSNPYPYGNNAANNGAPQQGGYSNPYPYANRYNYSSGNYPYNNGGYNAPRPQPNRTPDYAPPVAPSGDGNKKAFKIIGIVCGALVVVIIALIAVIISRGTPSATPETSTASPSSEQTTVNANVDELETQASVLPTPEKDESGKLTTNGIYTKIAPSSVGIIVYGASSEKKTGEGSGVILREDNNGEYTYIITCAHVINDAKSAVVQLYNNKEYEADIIGFDNRTDIGVLRIKAHGLVCAEIGSASDIRVGDAVYAIGNPGGISFAGSFTNGMVSALDRPVSSETSTYTMECIQHTAAINPGNSGGALVNAEGQLIGINSSKIMSEEYEGMGFAVPSSVFVSVFNNIVKNGYVADRAKIGITYIAAADYENYGMYVAMKGLPAGSLVVYAVSEDSDLAGKDVKKGDIITAVNGNNLADTSDLPKLIEKSKVGDVLTLTIVRVNMKDYTQTEFDVTVKLVEDRNGNFVESSSPKEESTTNAEDFIRDFFGEDFYEYYYGKGKN